MKIFWVGWSRPTAASVVRFDGISGQSSQWNKLTRYMAMSPFFKFSRITTPILIVQGSCSHLLRQKEADETYVGLRRLGKEVTYVIYEEDGHTHSSFVYPHQLDYWSRAIKWYDDHLR